MRCRLDHPVVSQRTTSAKLLLLAFFLFSNAVALPSLEGACAVQTASQSEELYEYLTTFADEPINVLMLYKLYHGTFPKTDDDVEAFVENNNLNVDRRFWRYCSIRPNGDTCIVRVLIDDPDMPQFRMDDGGEILTALAVFTLRSVVPGAKSSAVRFSGRLEEGRLRYGRATVAVKPFATIGTSSVIRLSDDEIQRLIHPQR